MACWACRDCWAAHLLRGSQYTLPLILGLAGLTSGFTRTRRLQSNRTLAEQQRQGVGETLGLCDSCRLKRNAARCQGVKVSMLQGVKVGLRAHLDGAGDAGALPDLTTAFLRTEAGTVVSVLGSEEQA